MAPNTGGTTNFLDRMLVGDLQARDELIAHARDRLKSLTEFLLHRQFPKVRRFEETDDVLQNVSMRLMNALAEIPLPCTSAHWWNIATQHIRWELLDKARSYGGKLGLGTNLHPNGNEELDQAPDPFGGPSTLEGWTHFHEQVDRLPREEQEVFRLLWFAGMTQEQAAAALGISLSTLRRRWLSARMLLDQGMNGASLS